MRSNTEEDVTAISIQLNELRSKFDKSIREGEIFDNLKQMYSKIKELECYLAALRWDPLSEPHLHQKEYDSHGHRIRETKYRYINEPPPLL